MWINFHECNLRRSILYGCETYYFLKENEMRQIERIEESFMRQFLKTTKGCPINQMYLELGQIPARFDIVKLRLFFLKYILCQEKSSLINQVFNQQVNKPTKNDWASTCSINLKELNIEMTFEEIEEMPITKFNEMVRQKCKESAYNYLMKRRGSKGAEIVYTRIQMSEYLLPNDEFNIENQRNLFSIRTRMVNIPSNFVNKENNHFQCLCGEKEDMKHIYDCIYLNSEEPEENFENLFCGNIHIQSKVFKRFEYNLKTREEYNDLNENESDHEIHCDPPYSSLLELGNG